MIVPGTRFRVAHVPLDRIVPTMREQRYPQRVIEYYDRLTDKQHANDDVLIHLAPHRNGLYRILDGHHRYLACLMAGRDTVLALVVIEPGQPGYETAIEPAAVAAAAEAEGTTITP